MSTSSDGACPTRTSRCSNASSTGPRTGGSSLRIAACADVHARIGDEARIRELFQDVRDHADVLVLPGDLTDHGRPVEAEALLRGLDGIGIPVLAVLGNHDHEAGTHVDVARMLTSAGITILDRNAKEIDGVLFAGAKGFGGGFGPRLVHGFGEAATKAFVAESVVEAEALRHSLRSGDARRKVAVLHYAPVVDTVQGEPPEIQPFLGTSRLAEAIDEGGAALAVHGHAHRGALQGKTPGGVPVWNVSLPLLRATGHKQAYLVLEV